MKRFLALLLSALLALSAMPALAQEAAAQQADIVIVGAGAAGMTAALNAYETGARNILLVEKLGVVGGGTTCATGGMHACDTQVMRKLGSEETMVDMFETAVRRGKGLGQPAVYGLYIGAATQFVDWLLDCGYDFNDIIYGDLHKPADKSLPGAYLANALYEQLTKRGIEVRVNTAATKLLTNERGAISGVVLNGPEGEYTVNCTAVILATGGFGANSEMVVANKPELAGIHMGNFPGCTGDGILMAQELGAAVCNMDLYKINTEAYVGNIAYGVPYAALEAGAIYVNQNGERFCNEMDYAATDVLAQPGSEYFALYNETIYQSLLKQKDELGWYDYYPLHYYMESSDAILKADTVEELAKLMGADAAALQTTLNGLAEETFGSDAAKAAAATWKEGPFYASRQTVGINHTLGGLVIDPSGRVYNTEGTPIFGLYAGGEVTGNAQGGDYYFGLMDAAVMGGVCGENAVYYVMDHTGLTEPAPKAEAAAVPTVEGNFTDGVYTGKARGHNADIEVKVTVENKSITSIEIVNDAETPNIFAAVKEQFIPAIISSQNLDTDVCSGATFSSNGVRDAVKNALNLQ